MLKVTLVPWIQAVTFTSSKISEIHNHPTTSFYLLTCVSFRLLQGILKDEDDINMLGEEFRSAYQKRRGNAFSEES